MPRDQSYMTRAMRARDPRYARVLGKLGYATAAPVPGPAAPPEAAPKAEDDEIKRGDLHRMRKAELAQFLIDQGFDVDPDATRSELLEAALSLENADEG